VPLTRKFLEARLAELKVEHAHAGAFCFFTDLANLPAIFETGKLLCRAEVLRRGMLVRDCASQTVLGKTPAWVHDYVRLYFAPATPMLYQIEGIKRRADTWPECPQPAYLVFHPSALLLAGIRVSDGNMASKYTTWREASDKFFGNLPFGDVYYRGSVRTNPEVEAVLGVDPQARDRFRRRQAEVLVPAELPLQYLRKLVFRSEAERDLAIADIGGEPDRVEVEVNKAWFFAQQRCRPYLDKFAAGSSGSLSIANLARGDTLTQIRSPRRGTQEAWSTTYGGTDWGPWKELAPSATRLPPPHRGRRTYFLLGHRVAEEADWPGG
jgi:hypothetical protein